MGKAPGNEKCCKGLKMTNFQSKHVALLKNKKDCADVYCVTLSELQAHRDAFIQNVLFHFHKHVNRKLQKVITYSDNKYTDIH